MRKDWIYGRKMNISLLICCLRKRGSQTYTTVSPAIPGKYDRAEVLKLLVNRVCNAYKTSSVEKTGTRPGVFETLPVGWIINELSGLNFAARGSLFARNGEKGFPTQVFPGPDLTPKIQPGPFLTPKGVVNRGHRYPLIRDRVILCPYTDKDGGPI